MIPPKSVKLTDKKAEKSIKELMDDVYSNIGDIGSKVNNLNLTIAGLQPSTPTEEPHTLTIEEIKEALSSESMVGDVGGDSHPSGNVYLLAGKGVYVNSLKIISDRQPYLANITLTSIIDPADTPASADALRDDLVANTIPSIEARLNLITQKINEILLALKNHGIIASS